MFLENSIAYAVRVESEAYSTVLCYCLVSFPFSLADIFPLLAHSTSPTPRKHTNTHTCSTKERDLIMTTMPKIHLLLEEKV